MAQPIPNDYFHHPQFISAENAALLLPLIRDSMSWQAFPPSPNSRQCAGWALGGGNGVMDYLLEGVASQIQSLWPVQVKTGAVFLNYYKTGEDYCPYHSDKYEAHVFTLSLGCTRDLLIKRNGPGKAEKFTLNSGDLYFMSNQMQSTHKHSVPPRKHVTGERISVVFFACDN